MIDVSVVQNLCRAIAEESDPDRTQELLDALREVIRDQQEEFRFRLLYVARQCAPSFADESDSSLIDRFARFTYRGSRRDAAAIKALGSSSHMGKSLFGRVCLTLLNEEFKPDE